MTPPPRPRSPLFGEEEPQLGLFDRPDEDAEDSGEGAQRELESIRDRLPAKLRFGTSSWTFPGWAGLVYHRRYPNQRAFLRESLGEYAQHPLMRTVGIDRGYYTPVPEEDLAAYSRQLPDDFRAAMKVWQGVAMPGYPKHPRYGADAGKANPDFLDAEVFARAVHEPGEDVAAHRVGAEWKLHGAPLGPDRGRQEVIPVLLVGGVGRYPVRADGHRAHHHEDDQARHRALALGKVAPELPQGPGWARGGGFGARRDGGHQRRCLILGLMSP